MTQCAVAPARGRRAPRFGPELAAWAGGQIVLLALLWAGVGLGPLGWLAGIAFITATCTLLTRSLRRSRTQDLGSANRVTLARAVIVGGVTALVADRIGEAMPTWVLVALAAVALALDGVDGHVARHTRTASSLGARFDMEVDAFLIAVLSVFAAQSMGAWVLAIGAMQYAFAAAAQVAAWPRSSLPPSPARRAVAALQGIALTVAAAGVLPLPATTGLVATALALLAWSFGRDTVWLWRHR